MPYLQSYRGDYLRGYRGDPGIFGFLKKAIGKVAGIGTSLLPGPIGAGLRMARGLVAPGRPPPGGQALPGGLRLPGFAPTGMFPGFGGARAPAVPGMRKRRRMNVANPKALRRAIRREQGFVKLARKALKGTGYRITRAGAARKPLRIAEHGPGSVTVQR